MFLDTMIEIGIWATARPRHEVSLANDELTSRIANIAETEREQGMCDYMHYVPPPSASSASCPYSPPPPSFVCSRSMGTPSFNFYYFFLLLEILIFSIHV